MPAEPDRHIWVNDIFRPTDRGYCLVTYQPEQLCAEALAAIDVTITFNIPALPAPGAATATLRETRFPGAAVRRRLTPHPTHPAPP